MKNNPWIEEDDLLKKNYGLLDEKELNKFLNLFNEWNKKSYILTSDIGQVKLGVQLLDFFEYSNENYNLPLFDDLCSIMGGEAESLYWIPLCSSESIIFQDFSPPMIAKTCIKKETINRVSHSFMQMLNGGYMFIDSRCRFIGIVVDGYYLHTYIKKEFMNDILTQYRKNWDYVDKKLDPLLKNHLMDRVKTIPGYID